MTSRCLLAALGHRHPTIGRLDQITPTALANREVTDPAD